jgi:hypothetical protein
MGLQGGTNNCAVTPGANISAGRCATTVWIFSFPLSECHLQSVLKSWIAHSPHGRPHMSLEPAIPIEAYSARIASGEADPLSRAHRNMK